MDSMWIIACSFVLIPLGILVHDVLLWRRLPPGPPPLPLIGNKHELPSNHPWIKFQEWSRTYGPIYTVWLGRRPTIVISDPAIASELLEKRSAKYSTRPRFVTMGEIYWDMASILVQPYGKEWTVRRKLLHSALTPRALENYKALQEAESARLCYQLLSNAKDFEALFDRLTSSIVFAISYGHRVDDMRSPVVRQRLGFMHYVSGLNVPGAYLVESFPVLKYLPDWIAPWKAEIKRRGRIEAEANMKLVRVVEADIESASKSHNNAPPVFNSLTKQLLENRKLDPASFPLSERNFSFIPASLFGAGSDTTASTLCSAILALVTTPGILETAQAELDWVIGPDRLPVFDDIRNLPYLRALCKEVLRWRPVAVLGGTPHASSEDDYYRGFYIPKGTVILGNSWAINLNPEYYPDPDKFNPLRFLDGDVDPASLPYLEHLEKYNVTSLAHPSKSGHSSFGWGRRICPGAELASNTLLITLSRLLWGFDVRPVPGVVYDTLDYTNGFNIRPRDLRVSIQVRSKRHRDVVAREYEAAMGFLETLTPFTEEML